MPVPPTNICFHYRHHYPPTSLLTSDYPSSLHQHFTLNTLSNLSPVERTPAWSFSLVAVHTHTRNETSSSLSLPGFFHFLFVLNSASRFFLSLLHHHHILYTFNRVRPSSSHSTMFCLLPTKSGRLSQSSSWFLLSLSHPPFFRSLVFRRK